MDSRFDIVIVGAGMAGASLAARIGEQARVLVIEAEERPGYHATGRSAAFWTESYGGPQVKPLTTASGPELHRLGVLTPRGALTIGKTGQEREIAAFAETYGGVGIEIATLDRAEIAARIPDLKPEWTCGVLEPSTCDIDVAALHQHYLAAARKAGVELWCRAGLAAVEREPGGWSLTLADGRRVGCDVLVKAGIRPLGIAPYRRTIAQVAIEPAAPDTLPLVLDVASRFYFKPESGRLWLSPHDETPSSPCDAAPEEIDVALAIDRFEQVVDRPVLRVEHRWAGLRSFAPDRLPVYGFAPEDGAFFWFAGQGGFGIQTAPAAAALGAGLLLGQGVGEVDPRPFGPGRFEK
jgi:D-arginine dehydrogenase